MRPIFSVILCLSVATVGCGRGDGPEKAIVRGKVSYQGAGVLNGEIRFYPADGTIGPVSGAPIKDGAYSAEAKGGVPVGKHRVVITAYRPLSGTTAERDPGYPLDDGKKANEQFLPAKFNTDSTLTAVVESGKSEQTIDFDLQD